MKQLTNRQMGMVADMVIENTRPAYLKKEEAFKKKLEKELDTPKLKAVKKRLQKAYKEYEDSKTEARVFMDRSYGISIEDIRPQRLPEWDKRIIEFKKENKEPTHCSIERAVLLSTESDLAGLIEKMIAQFK